MRGEILGIERCWGDDEKLAILSAVGVDSAPSAGAA